VRVSRRGAADCDLAGELDAGLPAEAADFAAREGEIESRSFANIFFNMTMEAAQRLRIVHLCNYHMPGCARVCDPPRLIHLRCASAHHLFASSRSSDSTSSFPLENSPYLSMLNSIDLK
jgi:hypothetical protein